MSSKRTKLNLSLFEQALEPLLSKVADHQRLLVAYSGGVDSHVLLHLLSQLNLNNPLVAIHVDHGLHASSPLWAEHCLQTSEQLGLVCHLKQLHLDSSAKGNLEEMARDARYQAIAELMSEGDQLLTAHNLDDQAETLLLRLLRGSGPKGLSAMQPTRPFANGQLQRPLLTVSRQQIEAYAQHHQLRWVEDESNQQITFDRNFLRHQVIPVLKERWPHLASSFALSARQCGDGQTIVESLADEDLLRCRATDHAIELKQLSALPQQRVNTLLRQWMVKLNYRLPSRNQLEAVVHSLIPSDQNRSPLVCWPDCEIRRYDGKLYALSPTSPATRSTTVTPWNTRPLELPGNGVLSSFITTAQQPLLQLPAQAALTIRYRQGGEVLQRVGEPLHHRLKNLFQQARIAPWLRSQIPLIYWNETLIAVADLWIADEFATNPGESGLRIHWEKPLIYRQSCA